MHIEFAKGHGTRNDFVLFADADNLFELTTEQVAFVCDRRGGIGADGILRAVRAERVPGLQAERDRWFMDYRNADGSIAEMCGNGLRVFLRYLEEEGLVTGAEVPVVTRAGLRTGRFLADGRIAVTMGAARIGPTCGCAWAKSEWPATSVDVGNPHAVADLEADANSTASTCAARRPGSPPTRSRTASTQSSSSAKRPAHLRLRVHERGVGRNRVLRYRRCCRSRSGRAVRPLHGRGHRWHPGG